MIRIDSDLIRGIEKLTGGGTRDLRLRRAFNQRAVDPGALESLVRSRLSGGSGGYKAREEYVPHGGGLTRDGYTPNPDTPVESEVLKTIRVYPKTLLDVKNELNQEKLTGSYSNLYHSNGQINWGQFGLRFGQG